MSGTLGLQCRSYLTDVSACFTLLWQSCWPLDRFTGLLMPHMSTNQRGKPSESVQLFSCYDKLWLPKEQTHTRGSNAHTQWIRGTGLLTVLGTDPVCSCRVLAILWTLAKHKTCDSASYQSWLSVLPAALGRSTSHSQDLSNIQWVSGQKQHID